MLRCWRVTRSPDLKRPQDSTLGPFLSSQCAVRRELGRGREALGLGITLPSQYLRYWRFPVGVGVWLAMQLAMNAS
jgi:hypothetical protein